MARDMTPVLKRCRSLILTRYIWELTRNPREMLEPERN